MVTRLFDNSVLETPEEALDFVANLLESSTEYSILGMDLDGTILVWNEGARRLYGYEPSEILSKAAWDIPYTPQAIAAGQPGEIMGVALRDGKWEGIVIRVR